MVLTDMTFQRAAAARNLSFELPAHGASVREARRRVRTHLEDQGCGDDTCETAVLLVSELVTNAVRHAGSSSVTCSVRPEADGVRIEVEDHGEAGTSATLLGAACDDVHGRGLQLVEALSKAWGVRERDGGPGCVVWALLPDAEGVRARPSGIARSE